MRVFKQTTVLLACVLLVTQSARSSGFFIVKVSDTFKETETKIVTMEEYKSLNQRLQKERMYHSKAVKYAEAKWKETYPGHRYPGRRLASRTMRVLHRANTMERAKQQIQYMKQFKININAESNHGGGGGGNRHGRNNNWQQEEKRREEERKKKDAENRALLSRAHNLYAQELNALIAERYPEMVSTLEPVKESGALPAKTAGSGRTIRRMGSTSSSLTSGSSGLVSGGTLSSGDKSLSKKGSIQLGK